MSIDQQLDLQEYYLGDDIDEIHEKRREREERRISSNKARAKRQLIKDKKARNYEAGFGGNV